MKKGIKKAVLAYSGGLDTSVIIRWLKENYGCLVITYTADIGQGKDLKTLKKKAQISGADKVIVENLKQEFAYDYILPALQANAIYENKYLLTTALSRPLIAKKLVSLALREKADTIVHGCTGKGNDQVRFEVAISKLSPKLRILAPLREWEMKSREEEIKYAKKYKIPIKIEKEAPYSIDRNLWGVSVECGKLEDPWIEPPLNAYQITVDAFRAPDNPLYLMIDFEKGVPTKINGKKNSLVQLIEKLNTLGGKYGIGRIDMVENRLVGIKSREIYECPAAMILSLAHRELESLILERELLHYKELISHRYGELIYYGLWYSPLREAFASFVQATQKEITGTLRLKLYKGLCQVVGRKSPYSLYHRSLATYTKEDAFNHSLAEGFIKLWGLPLKIKAMLEQEKNLKAKKETKRKVPRREWQDSD